MAVSPQYLQYKVILRDQAQVAALYAQYPLGRRMAPDTAAALYSAPIQLHDAPFVAPALRSQWFGNESKYPTNVAEFELCSGGWFGICFLFGTRVTYRWVANYVYAPPPIPEVGGGPVEPVAIATRRWVDGFNFPIGGAGINNDLIESASRDAARSVSGRYGLALRAGNSANQRATHLLADLVPGIATRASWERWYLRPRQAGTSVDWLWCCLNSSGNGAVLGVNPDLSLSIANLNGATITTIASGGQLELDAFHKIDLLLSFATAASGVGAVLQVWVNGVLVLSHGAWTGTGLASQTNHTESRLGATLSPAITGFYDLADWINAEWPSVDSAGDYTGLDWLNGSRVVPVLPTGYGTGNDVSWAADYRAFLQSPSDTGGAQVTSSSASAPLVLNTDAVYTVDGLEGGIGMAALVVSMFDSQAGGGDGLLGFKLNGVTTLTSIDQTAGSKTWHVVGYFPAGVEAPDPISPTANPFELRFVKSADASQCAIGFLGAEVEVLGVFGPEDVIEAEGDAPAIPARQGAHNAPYPTTVWAQGGVAPQSPVVVVGGTYVGATAGVDLTFRAPVNWLWVRRVAAAGNNNLGARWFSAAVGPHNSLESQVQPDFMVQAVINEAFVGAGDDNSPEQQFILRITGTNARANTNGQVYQYIAVCDPGARFMLNGALVTSPALASQATPLHTSTFLAVGGFVQVEFPDTDTAARLYYKGPGHLGTFASLLSAAEANSRYSFAAGILTTLAALHIENYNVAYNLWRLLDGNAPTGVVVQILSYVGDGVSPRTIDLTPVSLRRPLFGLVVPHNAASIQRDPSNLTTASQDAGTGAHNAATGIVGGGIDQIMVGSALNTLGITYDVFVIPGGTAACEAGWSCNGEFFPVEPEPPVDGPWDPPPGADPNPPAPPVSPICPTPVVPSPG